MKNVIIAVLSATTIFFGYQAYLAPEKTNTTQVQPPPSEKESDVDPYGPDFKSAAIEEYENAKFFDQTFIPFNPEDSIYNVEKMIRHYHTRLLPTLNPRPEMGIDNDSLVTIIYKFKTKDLRKLLGLVQDDYIYIHNGAMHPEIASKVTEQTGVELRNIIHKPTLILVAKSRGLTNSNYAVAPAICPPPKSCLK